MPCRALCCVASAQVRRFVKYNLGEGLEKKANDFAAEVAQQTQKKEAAPAKPAAKEQPKQPVSVLGSAGHWLEHTRLYVADGHCCSAPDN